MKRRQVAGWYVEALKGSCVCPGEKTDARHVYHLYVIRTRDRDGLKEYLERAGIPTLMHYPVPVHLQDAYRDLGYRVGDLPVTETTTKEILSLPMHPAVTDDEVRYVGGKICEYFAKRGETR